MSNKKFALFLVSVYFLGFVLEYKIYPYMMNHPIFWEQCLFSSAWPPILITQAVIVLCKFSFIGIAYAIDNYLHYIAIAFVGILFISLLPDKEFLREEELKKCKDLLAEHGIKMEE